MSQATAFRRPTSGLPYSVILIVLTAFLVSVPRSGRTEFETVLGVDFETMSLDDATLVTGEDLEEGRSIASTTSSLLMISPSELTSPSPRSRLPQR